jgi:3-mercaptopyruvate sulfurtransferase SseA
MLRRRNGRCSAWREKWFGYLALRVLGYPRVRMYTGSWKEWGDRDDLPIEHPV